MVAKCSFTQHESPASDPDPDPDPDPHPDLNPNPHLLPDGQGLDIRHVLDVALLELVRALRLCLLRLQRRAIEDIVARLRVLRQGIVLLKYRYWLGP